ncbi:hypothetical protein, partial [Brucella sp. 04-5288]|uniref:hypothetical protein n=1 Tax=Brucella sp. 04-5288 TaxID=1341688 RepID=UPI001AEC5571
ALGGKKRENAIALRILQWYRAFPAKVRSGFALDNATRKGLHFEPKVRSGFASDNATRKGLHFQPKVQSSFAFGTMLWGSAHVSRQGPKWACYWKMRRNGTGPAWRTSDKPGCSKTV